jgi:hypothetical protein
VSGLYKILAHDGYTFFLLRKQTYLQEQIKVFKSKYMEIGGSAKSADQQKRKGWGCHGLQVDFYEL